MAQEQLVRTEHLGDITIVSFGSSSILIRGALPEEVAASLLTTVQNALQKSGQRLLFDMHYVEFCNSTFIELLVRCWRCIKREPHAQFVLCNLHPYCQDVLEVTNLTHVWKIYPDRATALEAMQQLA